MKKYLLAALLLPLWLTSHAQHPLPLATKSLTEAQAQAQVLADTIYLQQHYTKTSYQVPMRDGVKLYTIVYVPNDADHLSYPLMLKRTPYSIGPYAPTRYPLRISPSSAMLHEGYIFVFQDVRGKYMSEGTFVDVRPELDKHTAPRVTDESTDTYDTIEFLLKKGPQNNGRVGQ